jgi:aminoglycoside phosphotransferase (APT) family kinase protein
VADERLAFVHEVVAACGLPDTRARQAVVLRGRGRGRKHLVMLPAARGESSLVVKVVRREHRQDLDPEWAALEALAGRKDLPPAIPEPVGWFEMGGWNALAQRLAPGTSLAGRILTAPRVARPRLAVPDDAVQWLAAFQLATPAGREPLVAHQRIATFLATLPEAVRTTPAAAAATGRLVSAAEEFDGTPVPKVWAHGDFWPGNILRRRGGVSVLDWAGLDRHADPWSDIWFFLFATTHLLGARRGRPWDARQVFDRAFLDDGPHARRVARVARRFLTRAGVPAGMHELSLLLWLLDRLAAPGDTEVVGPTGPGWDVLAFDLLRCGGAVALRQEQAGSGGAARQ